MSFLFGGSGNTTTTASQNTTANTTYDPRYLEYMYNILNKAQDLGERPYEPYDVNKMFAGLTPDQQAAMGQVRDSRGQIQPYIDSAKGALDKVSGYDPLAAAQPYLDRAGQAITPWEAGSGLIGASTQKWTDPGVSNAYMGDYFKGAINRANDLSERNFAEKTMPTINSQFAMGEGALGRSNYNKFAGRAVRDLGREESGNAQTIANNAYFNAAGVFGSDQNRLLNAGTAAANTANTNIGALSNMATTNANITSGAVNTGLGIAGAYTDTGGKLMNVNLQNADALMKSGTIQQQEEQKPLTALAMQDRERKQWDFEKVNFLNNAQRGLSIPTTQTSSTNSSQTGGSSSSPSILGQVLGGASILGSIPGVSDAVGGIFKSGNTGAEGTVGNDPSGFNPQLPVGANNPAAEARGGYIGPEGTRDPRTYARGGYIRRYAKGGPVGALSRRRFANGGYAAGGDVPVMRGLISRNPSQGMPPAMGPAMGPAFGAMMPPAIPMARPQPGPLNGGLPPAMPPIGALGGLEG